jgi:hypothetical protein
MIVKGCPEQTLQAVNSLVNLYDGIIIAVDSREDSDEIAKELSYYPNMHVYRQNFKDFNSFGKARQDVLNRVPCCDYVGRSDGDELLASNPIEFRKWLEEVRPDAVRGATYYAYDSGWCKAGETLRTDGIRVWKHGTRAWKRPAHEYPYPIVGEDNWIDGDILFNHINKEAPGSKMDFIVALMQQEVDAGNLEYMWYQAREYVVGGQTDKAISLCFDYLLLGVRDEEIFNLALWGMVYLSGEQKDYEGLLKKLHIINLIVKENPDIQKHIIEIEKYWRS